MELTPIKRIIMCQCCSHFFETEREFRYHMRNEHRSTYPVTRIERCEKKGKNRKELWHRVLHSVSPGQILREGTFRIKLCHVVVKWNKTNRYAFS